MYNVLANDVAYRSGRAETRSQATLAQQHKLRNTPLESHHAKITVLCSLCADTRFGAMILAVACGTLLLFAATRH
jgi:hypothetical protein